jgi:hypothetical protein
VDARPEPVAVKNVTVVIPWDKRNPRWLEQAVRSLPPELPYVICPNDSKTEMAEQLNQAFAEATTDYCFLMNADDVLGPDCLQMLAEAIGTADVAYPSLHDYDRYHRNLMRDLLDEIPDVAAAVADEYGIDREKLGTKREWDVRLGAEPPSFWNLQDINHLPGVYLARTELLREIPQTSVLVEDWAWHFKAMAFGARYVPVRDAKYLYRRTENSLSDRIDQAVGDNPENHAAIKWSIRESVYSTLFAGDPEAKPIGRVPIAATFYASASETQAYVRSVMPARYLPGTVRHWTWDEPDMDRSKAVILQHPGRRALEVLMPHARKQGKRIVVDVDDDYISPTLVGEARKAGMDKIADQWTTEQPAHKQVVREADTIICSTPALAYRYEKLNPNTVVIPNMADPRDWAEPMRIDDGIIRVGWFAGMQHGPDAHLVEGALRWASEQPGVLVCVAGVQPDWDFDYVQYQYTRSLQGYRDLCSILDIGLAPLVGSRMNDGKSDLKWLDYTMAGALTIASDRPAYATIEHEKTGLLARNASQFKHALKRALDDPEMTMELIGNARQYVFEERGPARWRSVYLAACGVKPYPIRPVMRNDVMEMAA